MLLWIAALLSHYIHGFQVVHYLSLRAILSALTSLIIALCTGPVLIRKLTKNDIGQVIREVGPKSHYSKAGTPTMGGVMILIAVTVAILLWGDLSNRYIWLVLVVTLGFGGIGFMDDYLKLTKKNSRGLPAKWKYLAQSFVGFCAAIYLYRIANTGVETGLVIPFTKSFYWQLGAFYVVFVYFVIVGSSNAVNLTDGLDGLATLPAVLVAGALGIFAYVTGNLNFAHYLSLPYVEGVGEITVFAGAIVGAGLGFLWFNTYPAQIFMGDVGSLALGAALGVMACVVHQEIVLFIMGGVFVMETLSVILQVGSFKLRGGKRIFKMAPIHHHFELKGWPEPKVIVRFWIMTVILVLLGLATLKIR